MPKVRTITKAPQTKGRHASEFSAATILFLRDQVGNQCSLCDRPTSGPSREQNKRTNVGTAAHITAAAPGGPRYEPTLTSKQRGSHENGIWCCRDCGKLVDDDASTYDVPRLQLLKEQAIARALHRVTVGEPSPRKHQPKTPSFDDLRIRWDEELEDMQEFCDRALKKPGIARELQGWNTPFWNTRKRQLARVFGHTEWWVSTTTLYKQWNEAKRGFPTIERYARPTMTTGFRMERAAESLQEAECTTGFIRRCLAVEAELAAVMERDRRDAIRICDAGAKSASGGYGGLATQLGIKVDSVACRLAIAAWNFSSDAQPREQDAKAAQLLRTGWLPSAEVMMIEGAGASRAFDRLKKRTSTRK